MKKLIILLIVLLPVVGVAQESKFNTEMNSLVKGLDTANKQPMFVDLLNGFYRVSEMEKEEWLPKYYAAYCNIRLSTFSQDPDKIDEYLDKAMSLCKEVEDYTSNSEILAIMGRIAFMKTSLDPMTRGPKYSTMTKEFLNEALAINPKNPRAHLIYSQYYYYTPEFFGGDKETSCAHLEKSKNVFAVQNSKDGIDPRWGANLTDILIKTNCN
ncbi:hypothetical protein JKA74_09640 [Marivirga sp. S37H4]|uniref:Tetratricopeptide repeat protein n=1 Tax=Marivirga aurantiaca TaxID=2802615 RepID=A0A935C909_9BACT|nr:hypothetical protein [Marivirga aurantiaca]MBK6265302.1 hypothetical protein [Marivirga aurantiaca]